MASAEFQNLLAYLQKLEHGCPSDPHTKDIVRRLKLKIHFLISRWKIEHEISILENLIEEYDRSAMGSIGFSGQQNWESSLKSAKFVLSDSEKLRFIKPEIEELYSTVSNSVKSSKFENHDEDVVSFINSIVENLKDILIFKSGILVPLKPYILPLEEELRFLRNFLCFISQFRIEKSYCADLYTFTEVIAVNTAYLLHFLRVDEKIGQDMECGIKIELLDLVNKLKPIQQPDIAEIYLRALEGISQEPVDIAVIDYECILRFFDCLVDNLRELLKMNYFELCNDQIKIICEELSSLRFYLMDFPLHDSNEDLDNFMFRMQELTVQIGRFYFNICKKKNQCSFWLFSEGLLDKIENAKRNPNHLIIPRSWQLNFPKTNGVGYIDLIIKTLEDQLHCKSAPIDGLRSQINTVHEGLVELRGDFGGLLWNDNEKLKAVFTRYRDVAYQTEYFVDSSICGVVSLWYQKMGLFNLGEELEHIKNELKAIIADTSDHNICMSPSLAPLKSNAQSIDSLLDSENEVQKINHKDTDQLVGLEDEVEKIRNQIIRGPRQKTIIPIVGMPGLGKTTLANSLYMDPSVTMHFHARAWCTVSQVYNKETLLLEILHQVQPKSLKDEPFDQKLYKSLKGRRYLIVMDDIWDIEAWDDLRPSLPNDENGSRIIFTTRNQSVAIKADSIPHALRLLSDEESLKLLLVKVFKDETCPLDFLQVGKKIAENCKGLPLIVVLIAGLLRIRERTKDSWEQFANVLISHEVNYPLEQHLGILELSYRHLPHYLRPCFLYFGAFSEDAEIPVWKLARLWIAEGFVQPKLGLNSLEVEAGNYLNDLIDRSLVMIAKRSYNGGVKTCRIHDLLHDFCTGRAKEENFLMKINRSDSHSTLTDSEVHEQYRLYIRSTIWSVPPVRMGHLESRIRSLWFSKYDDLHINADSPHAAIRGMPSSRLFSPPSSSRFRYHNKLRGVDIFFKFKLLRVLDLGTLGIIAEECFDSITQLVHLRYLSILAYVRTLPGEIENLNNLETFLLNADRYGYVALPETIWNMAHLRHIQVNSGVTAFFPDESFANRSKLNGLTTLSTLIVHRGKELEKTMRKLPNLKKLKCMFLGSYDDAEIDPNCLLVLDFCDQLEELSISNFFQHGTFPVNLKKLSLSDLLLSPDQFSDIGKLPNLEVLKLWKAPFGDKWDMEEGEFEKLKVLKLIDIDLRIWNASTEPLPCFEKLVLKSMMNLEKIPIDFGDISSLKMIEVFNCKTSVKDSAREIEEQQCDYGNDQFKLYISR